MAPITLTQAAIVSFTCPEQWDGWIGKNRVVYVRERHDNWTVYARRNTGAEIVRGGYRVPPREGWRIVARGALDMARSLEEQVREATAGRIVWPDVIELFDDWDKGYVCEAWDPVARRYRPVYSDEYR